MAVIRWDPFTAMGRLDEQFDELVRRTWGSAPTGAGRAGTSGYVPAIDMARDGADVVITFELPGVDVEHDVEIEVAEGRLTVSGERRDLWEERDESNKVLVRELRSGAFRREFALPDSVSPDDVEATYDRGLLMVRVSNVAKPATPPRKVPIKGAEERKTIAGHTEQS